MHYEEKILAMWYISEKFKHVSFYKAVEVHTFVNACSIANVVK